MPGGASAQAPAPGSTAVCSRMAQARQARQPARQVRGAVGGYCSTPHLPAPAPAAAHLYEQEGAVVAAGAQGGRGPDHAAVALAVGPCSGGGCSNRGCSPWGWLGRHPTGTAAAAAAAGHCAVQAAGRRVEGQEGRQQGAAGRALTEEADAAEQHKEHGAVVGPAGSSVWQQEARRRAGTRQHRLRQRQRCTHAFIANPHNHTQPNAHSAADRWPAHAPARPACTPLPHSNTARRTQQRSTCACVLTRRSATR